MVCGLHIFQRFIWKPIQYQLHIIVKREARLDQIYKTDLNELFSYQRKGEKLEEKEKVIEIEIERLRDFKEHPFHVKDDKEMSLLKESIKNYGILSNIVGFIRYYLSLFLYLQCRCFFFCGRSELESGSVFTE